MSHSANQQLALSTKPQNVIHTMGHGTSAGFVKVGQYNMPASQQHSLQESYDIFNVNPYSTPAVSAFQNGSATSYVDFILPSSCGEMVKVVSNLTITNTHSTNAHVWEAPVMPFGIHHVEVWQSGAQIGQTIPALALWKWYGYTQTLNEMTQLQARSTIDKATYALTSGSNLAAGASHIYSIDWAPLLFLCQARVNIKQCKPVTLRFYFENITNLAPTNTNTTNASIQLTSFTLQITQRVHDGDGEARIVSAYKGPVDGRCVQYWEERASFNAVTGQNVQYNTNAFNNSVCALVDVSLRNSNPSGANLISFSPITQMYVTDQNNVSLQNSLQPSASDYLDQYYPLALPDNIFTKASNINIYPLLIGSTSLKETLKTSRQLGFKVLPNRAILNITCPSTATYQLVIGAWVYSHVRCEPGNASSPGSSIRIY